MPKTLSDSGSARPLLDIASYARRGPGQRDRLSPEEIQLIERTVRRTPEVMVKVLSRGGQDMKSVGRHFAYLSRKGDLEIETDDGRHIEGRGRWQIRGRRAEADASRRRGSRATGRNAIAEEVLRHAKNLSVPMSYQEKIEQVAASQTIVMRGPRTRQVAPSLTSNILKLLRCAFTLKQAATSRDTA